MSARELLRGLAVFDRALPSFDVEAAPDEPVSLFLAWLSEAIGAGVCEPHAMTLATADERGLPDTRVLILKDVDDSGWQFATSRLSAKGAQLAVNPQASLNFYWREQGRQVRVRGEVAMAADAVSAADFLARPEGSRIAGLVGRQSAALDDPASLVRERAVAEHRLAEAPDTVAADHAVYAVRPAVVEFWQGDAQRRHVRLRYRRVDGEWKVEGLWP